MRFHFPGRLFPSATHVCRSTVILLHRSTHISTSRSLHACTTPARFLGHHTGSAAGSTKTAASKVTTVAIALNEGGSQGENSGPDVAPLQT